jgi:hypothetical protein
MNTTVKLLCLLTLLTGALLPARAGSPEYLNYQGLLNGADGLPLSTASYTMEFNIYDSANGNAKQWGPFLFDGGTGDGHGSLVPVANGRFNVIIGPKDTNGASILNAFASSNRFIEIKVNGGSHILPRQQFLSTPYAFKANTADQATQATVAASVSDVNIAYLNTANTFTANQTVTGSVTASGGFSTGGNVSAGGNVTVGDKSVAVAEENLRIVRGSIIDGQPGASTWVGAGFTIPAPGHGSTTPINFTPPFSDIPSINVTVVNPTFAWRTTVSAVTRSNCLVQTWNNSNAGQRISFNFIAIGPR